jgi:hypothetical protein
LRFGKGGSRVANPGGSRAEPGGKLRVFELRVESEKPGRLLKEKGV